MIGLNKLRITVGAFIAVLILAGGLAVSFLWLRAEHVHGLEDYARELRHGLVHNCEINSNPLRQTLTIQLKEQIAESERFHSYKDFFPNVPISELRVAIEKQNARRREQIERLHPLDCQTLFPEKGAQ